MLKKYRNTAEGLKALGDTAMICDPQTILALLNLIELQHEALEYAADLTKPEGMMGCDCAICTAIKAYEEAAE